MDYCPHCGEKTWTDGKGCEGACRGNPRPQQDDCTSPTKTTPARDRLNAWIKASPHSKGDFADMIKVNPASLSRILNGDTKKPDAKTLKAIEDATGGAIVMQEWVE